MLAHHCRANLLLEKEFYKLRKNPLWVSVCVFTGAECLEVVIVHVIKPIRRLCRSMPVFIMKCRAWAYRHKLYTM